MASESSQVPPMSTPSVKFETSPAESFLSTPGEIYPSLFDTSPTINPVESIMTPPASTDLVSTPAVPASTPAATPDATVPTTSETTEKKPVKKRKSWGQVLPEPKTNLPPRKRAKTEDEKEQRRVERVLRNRRAAQSSRERKRQEVEALEQRCKQLEAALISRENTVNMLMEEMKKLRRNSCASSPASSAFESFHPSPLTLSQPLSPSSTDEPAHGGSGVMDDFILMPESNNGTLDPASLSPELNPVADNIEQNNPSATAATTVSPTTAVTSSDVTQHPAAVLCDLQCQSVEVPRSWVVSRQVLQPTSSLFLQLQALLTAYSVMLSSCLHPLTLIAGALKTNLALLPTPSILSTIIWLVTLPPNFRSSTSSNSSAVTTAALRQARQRPTARSPKNPNPLSASSTLRLKSLQKLLTSSPILARPLMDATMGLLRLVSEGRDDRIEGLASGSPGIKGDRSRGPLTWPDGTSLPSRELLLTLLWAIRVEKRKILSKEKNNSSPPVSRSGSSILQEGTQPHNYVLSLTRKRQGDTTTMSGAKRFRFGV